MLSVAGDLWRDERRGAAAIAARQRARLRELVVHARAHSPHYRDRYRGLPGGPVELRALPPVTKPELMADFDRWVTDPRVRRSQVETFIADPDNIGREHLGRYLVFTTSGTTGEPALLLQDHAVVDVFTAISLVRVAPRMLDARTLGAVVRAGGRSASVWATGRPFGGASLVRRQVLRRPSRARRLRVFSAATPVDDLVAQLNAFAPVMLSGYASALTLLAREQRAGRLAIRPAVINNGGETLTDAARAEIAAAFGVEVANGYGSSEMLMIAHDCARGVLHVHADWVILEPVDEDGRPVPPGERSASVLLTNLANRVQPIIRYDLGDAVTVRPEPCSCGSPLPAIDVVGRTNDALWLQTAEGRWVELLPLPLITSAEAVVGVRGVQLVQTGADAIAIRLDVMPGHVDSEVRSAVEARLHSHLSRHGLDAVALTHDPEPPQRAPHSAKLRQTLIAPGVPPPQVG